MNNRTIICLIKLSILILIFSLIWCFPSDIHSLLNLEGEPTTIVAKDNHPETLSATDHAQEDPLNCIDLNIGFLDEHNLSFPDQIRHPRASYLFSYGGSGNTITRILLEYITIIWTGSIFDDNTLHDIGFKGELATCKPGIVEEADPKVLVIKAHPEQLNQVRNKPDLFFKKMCLGYHHRNAPPIITNISAVFIVRDPWKAIFSMYQFAFGDEEGVDRHVQHKLLSKWDRNHWTEWVEKQTLRWAVTLEFMKLMADRDYPFIVVKYENLLNVENPDIVVSEFDKILRFLYSDTYYSVNMEMLKDRIRCIFPTLMMNDYGRLGMMHRKPANESVHLTFDTAYQYLINSRPDVLCRAWSKIKVIAGQYDYNLLPGIDCETDGICGQVIDEDHIGFLCDQNLSYPAQLRHSHPSYLFSFGGSGSTLTRLMLEYVTNIWTGSVYGDRKLFNDGFRGEMESCGRPPLKWKNYVDRNPQVLLIKVHPEHLNDVLAKPQMMNEDCLGIHPEHIDVPSQVKQHCIPFGGKSDGKSGDESVDGMTSKSNVSAVFIVRDPWKSIFSAFQYKFGDEPGHDWHTRHKMQSSFVGENFIGYVKRQINEWIKTFKMMEAMDQMGYQYVTLKYENLINVQNIEAVTMEMDKVLRYLYSDKYHEEMKEIWRERIKCMVLNSMKNDYRRFGLIHRKPLNVSEHVSFEVAYQYLIEYNLHKQRSNANLGCELWQEIKEVATRFDYDNIPGLTCS